MPNEAREEEKCLSFPAGRIGRVLLPAAFFFFAGFSGSRNARLDDAGLDERGCLRRDHPLERLQLRRREL